MSDRLTEAAAPRVIYLVTEDWYFISHRLPMARAARNAGFEVHVATCIDRHGAAIEAEGFHLHPVAWRRGSMIRAILFAPCATCASSTVRSSPISPITWRCRRPSSAHLR